MKKIVKFLKALQILLGVIFKSKKHYQLQEKVKPINNDIPEIVPINRNEVKEKVKPANKSIPEINNRHKLKAYEIEQHNQRLLMKGCQRWPFPECNIIALNTRNALRKYSNFKKAAI